MVSSEIPKEELEKLLQAAEYDRQVWEELAYHDELTSNGYHPRMKQVHEDNLKLLETFLSRYGWPIPSKHGKAVFEAAWFISIHAISHPEQMMLARAKIKELLDNGEDVAHEYASLYDRIALYTGGKQRYGTQFWPSRNGWYLKNLDNEATAETYRAALGMQSLKDRWKEMEAYDKENGYISVEEEKEQELKFKDFLATYGWNKYQK